MQENIRTCICQWFRLHGTELEKFEASYFSENGMETIFDDRLTRAIAIPNCETGLDSKPEFIFDRAAEFGKWLNLDETMWRPADERSRASLLGRSWADEGNSSREITINRSSILASPCGTSRNSATDW